MDVAAAMRIARQSADLSQKRLARRAGLSSGAVSRYEAGTALPSLTALDRLLAAGVKDVRLVVIDRVDDLDAELARRAALSRRERAAGGGFMRPSFLERLATHDTQVLVAGAWAAGLHGVPTEAAEGRLLLPDDDTLLARLARAFMSGSVPWRETEGHFGSLPVRPTTFVEHPVARWTLADVGPFRTQLVPAGSTWPVEQRLDTPHGPLRVLAPDALTEDDGVLPEVLQAWRLLRATAGADAAGWLAAG